MEPWVQFSELRFASIVISWAPHLHLEVKWRASKTSSSSSTSWKISFPFPEKRKTYLVVGLFHLQVSRKKILRNKMIHLSLERGLSNCLPNCNYNIVSSNFEQGLQYRIRKYLPNCDMYILIHMYNHWITPGGYSSQIRGLCFMRWPSKKSLKNLSYLIVYEACLSLVQN